MPTHKTDHGWLGNELRVCLTLGFLSTTVHHENTVTCSIHKIHSVQGKGHEEQIKKQSLGVSYMSKHWEKYRVDSSEKCESDLSDKIAFCMSLRWYMPAKCIMRKLSRWPLNGTRLQMGSSLEVTGQRNTKKCDFRLPTALRRACEGMFSLSVLKALLWQRTKAIHQGLGTVLYVQRSLKTYPF